MSCTCIRVSHETTQHILDVIWRTRAASAINVYIFAQAGIKILSYNGGYCTILVMLVLVQFKVEESRGQPHVKPPCKNNSPKLPLAMQIQSVSTDCLKKRKKLEVLTRIQFTPHPVPASLCHPVWLISDIVSVHVSPHCSLV